MPVKTKIIKVLEDFFTPIYVDVVDFSESHRGHAGFREGEQTHFEVTLVSDKFIGKSRVARQRMVYDLFNDDLRSGRIHALTVKAITPDEAKNKNSFN